MKKRVLAVSAAVLIIAALLYCSIYPVTAEGLEARRAAEELSGLPAGGMMLCVGLQDRDYIWLTSSGDLLVTVKMEKGPFGRFRSRGASATDAAFVNGLAECGGRRYMVVGGRNTGGRISAMEFTLDNREYRIDIVNPGEIFLEYLELDGAVGERNIFAEDIALYDAAGEDITALYELGSGGI